jgi:hypothetical protein
LAGLDWVHQRRLGTGWHSSAVSCTYSAQYGVSLWFCLWGCSKKRELDRLAAARVVIPLLWTSSRVRCRQAYMWHGRVNARFHTLLTLKIFWRKSQRLATQESPAIQIRARRRQY